jgi:predicted Rossmann fold flavoprotein
MFDCIVIGAGAAGYFSAIQVAEKVPNARVLILEKSNKILSKVKVSGGGRCNVTNAMESLNQFAEQYPRGNKFMKRILHSFSPSDTIEWFRNHGVELKAEADGRMFPMTDSSQTIIDCLTETAQNLGVKLAFEEGAEHIDYLASGGFELKTNRQTLQTKTIIISTGGSPKAQGFQWLNNLNIKFTEPVPSLFTFNVKSHVFKDLMGLAVPVQVKIEGSSIKEEGPMLITHWGFSGPAVLRCSAWGARFLAEADYKFNIRIHWLPELNQDEIREWLLQQRKSSERRMVKTKVFDALPQRLWEALVERAGILNDIRWSELPVKQVNVLAEVLCADRWEIEGKTTFKEEFVTCGGIELSQLDPKTCMIKAHPGMFATGEILDVDGITGGFNFQNAWSSAFVAASGVAEHIK